jgi:predicted nucleotidyltransferase
MAAMAREMERAGEYVERLAEAYGEDLVAAALYGSAARGDYREGISDLNLLVILESVDARSLAAGSALAREWVAAGNPPPLVMSRGEWSASADVFPIEYADIRDAHRLLHGPELFTELTIAWADMRLQAERELKEKKIQLRESYLLAAPHADEVGVLLQRSFPTFLALFRAALRLLGESVPADPEAVVTRVAERIGIDPDPWLQVHRSRAEGKPLEPGAGDALAAAYIDGVTRASEWIDGLERGGDHPGV